MNELEAWLIWLRTPDTGAARIRRALLRFGNLADALAAGPGGWREIGISESGMLWLKLPERARIAADLRWLDSPEHQLLTCVDADFPPLLTRIPGAPAALFVRGDASSLWRPQIAIVGSRNASAGGLALARDFSATLARGGLSVTSGMADGIDGAAHLAALDAGALSIGVLGTGVDLVYPRKHARLAQRLVEQGALVSEFPLGTPGAAENFPRRNRIISGLSLGTLVIEAGLQSGSLITARLAAEQGREVFALPGSVHNPMARGCHRLIRDGAKLVETAAEVLEELVPLANELGNALSNRLQQLQAEDTTANIVTVKSNIDEDSSTHQLLLRALGFDPVDFDTLLERSGLTAAAISSMLTTMELEGEVAMLAGNCYQRIGFNTNAAPTSARKSR